MSHEERYSDRERELTDEERAEERRGTREQRQAQPREPETGEHGIYREPGPPTSGHDDAWSEQHDEEIKKRADAQRKQWHEASIEEGHLTEAEKAAEDRARGRGGEGPLESGA
jgi:hypothetical protein